MSPSHRFVTAWLLALSTVAVWAADAQPDTGSSLVTAFPAAYFRHLQLSSAFEMLAFLPGYQFSDSDLDVRGFAAASGNVLIDGATPASKRESLETLLRRIPASSVDRIEVIRAGAPGVDMHGQTILANVVRAHEAHTRGSVELGSAFYERGFRAPAVAAELSLRDDDRLVEFSGGANRSVDDEHGIGTRPRIAADGTVLRDGTYTQDEGDETGELAAAYADGVAGGDFKVTGSWQRTDFHADILDEIVIPEPGVTTVREFAAETATELGFRFERPLSAGSQLELLGIRHDARERGGEREIEADQSALFLEDADASESIVRGVLRRTADALTLEGGLEIAVNDLKKRSRLQENGIEMDLPGSRVDVEEQRGEVFATARWQLNPVLQAEAAARFEYSQLSVQGDTALDETFSFLKPRALVTWSVSDTDRLQLLLEREVGQLDFEDFASSASLSSNTVTAGNPDLKPEHLWRAEISWDRQFSDGSVLLAARHEEIADLVDRVPVIAEVPFDAVGNLAHGTRDELQVDLTLPLDRLKIAAAVLKVTALWRHSETTDPTTGASREISEDEPLNAEMHFTQHLPRLSLRWGIDATFASRSREFRFDEVRTDSLGTRWDVFAQYEPVPAWNIRIYANNLTDRASRREREVYDGARGQSVLRYDELRTLRIGPWYGISVRHVFGG